MDAVGRLVSLARMPTQVRLRRQARDFVARTHDCRQTQHEVLVRLLALNADSVFSFQHRLGEIRTESEFRRRLPVADFEAFRPWVERVKMDDHRALLGSGNPLLMFSLSSGTTAETKFIPITRQFFSDYRRGWQVWGIRAFDDHPGTHRKNIAQLSSDPDCFRSAGGTPCGSISGFAQASQSPIVQSAYTVPGIVSKISETDARTYTVLRLLLSDSRIGVLTTANPSTLIQMARKGDAWKERLIRDVADGTLAQDVDVPQEVRQKLKRRLRRRRTRARQLEQIVARTDQLLPKDYLSNLDVLAVWTGGSCAAYLESLREVFGDVPIRDHGLSASEGRMTIPLSDNDSGGVLDVATHYFEFIPEGEYENDDPRVLAAHELQEGKSYYILMTTSSGLYRYDIHDVVQCTGFFHTTPILRFLHKGAHVASITGEKLSESQIIAAVRDSAEQRRIRLDCFTMLPSWGSPPHYQLAIEAGSLPPQSQCAQLAADVDQHLQASNCEYRDKRKSGRLASVSYAAVRKGTWRDLATQRLMAAGGSAEQYKHPCLLPTLEKGREFLNEYSIRINQRAAG